jgi:hypothetical protein
MGNFNANQLGGLKLWSTVLHGTRYCILNHMVIVGELSKKYEMSTKGLQVGCNSFDSNASLIQWATSKSARGMIAEINTTIVE